MSIVSRLLQRLRNKDFRRPVLNQRCRGMPWNMHQRRYMKCNRPIDVTEHKRWNTDRALSVYLCPCGKRTQMKTRMLELFRSGYTSEFDRDKAALR